MCAATRYFASLPEGAFGVVTRYLAYLSQVGFHRPRVLARGIFGFLDSLSRVGAVISVIPDAVLVQDRGIGSFLFR